MIWGPPYKKNKKKCEKYAAGFRKIQYLGLDVCSFETVCRRTGQCSILAQCSEGEAALGADLLTACIPRFAGHASSQRVVNTSWFHTMFAHRADSC